MIILRGPAYVAEFVLGITPELYSLSGCLGGNQPRVGNQTIFREDLERIVKQLDEL